MEDSLKSFWGMAATIVEGAAALLIERSGCTSRLGCCLVWNSSLRLMLSAPQLRRLGWTLDNWLLSPQSVRFSATFSIKTLKRCSIQERAPIKVALKVAALSPYPRHLLLEPVDQTSANLPRNHQHWRVHGTI